MFANNHRTRCRISPVSVMDVSNPRNERFKDKVFKSAAQLLVGWRFEDYLSYLDPRPARDDALARPRHRLVHVSGFQ